MSIQMSSVDVGFRVRSCDALQLVDSIEVLVGILRRGEGLCGVISVVAGRIYFTNETSSVSGQRDICMSV